MTLFDRILKKRKKEAGAEPAEENRTATQEKVYASAPPPSKNAVFSTAGVIRSPHITEKTSSVDGTYVFVVRREANKTLVRRAVEARYGVNVERVRMLRMPAKERRRGRIAGWRPGFKKAVVTIRRGQKIELE